MRSLYLFRLYRQSKIGFIGVSLFVFVYALLLVKRMDMMLFPYNAMFAYNRSAADSGIVYRVKASEQPVLFTAFAYWKKDLLETAAFVYGRYVEAAHQVYLEQYLRSKPAFFQYEFLQALYPSQASTAGWYRWYARLAGLPDTKRYRMWKYKLVRRGHRMQAMDSVCLETQLLP